MSFLSHSLCLILISVSAHSITVNRSPKSLVASDRELLPEPEIPKECLDQGYCEHVRNYPENHAAKLIAKLQKKSTMEQNLLTKFNYTDRDVHKSRVQLFDVLCKVEKETVTPKAAKDFNGTWHFILNHAQDPIQSFYAVKCKPDPSKPNKQQMCDDTYIEILGASGRCKQQNVTLKLMTMDRYGDLIENQYSIPCCCSCEAYQN